MKLTIDKLKLFLFSKGYSATEHRNLIAFKNGFVELVFVNSSGSYLVQLTKQYKAKQFDRIGFTINDVGKYLKKDIFTYNFVGQCIRINELHKQLHTEGIFIEKDEFDKNFQIIDGDFCFFK